MADIETLYWGGGRVVTGTSESMRESELTGLSSGLVLEKAQVRKKDRRPVQVRSMSVM